MSIVTCLAHASPLLLPRPTPHHLERVILVAVEEERRELRAPPERQLAQRLAAVDEGAERLVGDAAAPREVEGLARAGLLLPSSHA